MTFSLNFSKGIALVVGGSGGIGSVIASRLALAGTQVAITYYKNKSAAEDLCKEINQKEDKCFPYELDIRDEKAVKKLIEDLLDKFSNIHSVINAAGFDIPQKMIAELDQETWRKVIDADLNGFFNLVSSSLIHLRKNGGTYIFISSAGLSRYPPGDILSVAPKAAIESLIKGIAKEEGVNNIRANSIALGVIETGIFLRLKNEDNSFFDDKWEQAVLKNLALKRFGQPEEVADLAVFLASEQASYITGQFIAVDGGYGI
jgi:NAD(P)-dependent dehydrogenase (short-subunit alcohol dehydrogenase family)